jgi:hypothetical protein
MSNKIICLEIQAVGRGLREVSGYIEFVNFTPSCDDDVELERLANDIESLETIETEQVDYLGIIRQVIGSK